jgi:hypothetical protein
LKENVCDTAEEKKLRLRNGILRFSFESSDIHIDRTFDRTRHIDHDFYDNDAIEQRRLRILFYRSKKLSRVLASVRNVLCRHRLSKNLFGNDEKDGFYGFQVAVGVGYSNHSFGGRLRVFR